MYMPVHSYVHKIFAYVAIYIRSIATYVSYYISLTLQTRSCIANITVHMYIHNISMIISTNSKFKYILIKLGSRLHSEITFLFMIPCYRSLNHMHVSQITYVMHLPYHACV